MKYLILPRLSFSGANAQPAWWCIAAPGPATFAGFAQALARHLGLAEPHVRVGVIFHDWALRAETPGKGEWLVHPHQFRAAALIDNDDYAQGSKTLSGQPTVRGDGCVTLVIEVADGDDVNPKLVSSFLARARIAGGQVFEHGFAESIGHVYPSWDEARSKLRTGFTFVDRMDLMAAATGESLDPLDRFLAATRREDKKPIEHGWLMPYVAGWLAISPIQGRNLTRDALPHAFAEPLIGLGQLASVRSSDITLWRMEKHDARTDLLTQKKPALHQTN